MPEIVEKGYILSFDEIRILLYGMGVCMVEGVYMQEKSFTDTEIIQALHHMARRGLILSAGERFCIREDLRKALEVMSRPEETFTWSTKEEGSQEYFCYVVPGQVAVSERYWKKKDTLKLRLFTTAGFEAWKEQAEDDNRGDRGSHDGEAV